MTRPLCFILLSLFALPFFAHAQEYNVGMAEEDVTPVIGAPLAGYGGIGRRMQGFLDWGGKFPYANFLKPSTGVLDPIRSKAMIIERGGKKILFVSLDVVGVTRNIYDSMRVQLKRYGFDEIFFSATHTHSGPGALSHSWVWEVIATDQFRPEVFWPFLAGIERSVKKATAAMQPASLYRLSFKTEKIQSNRRGHEGHLDPMAHLLLAQNASGRWLGGILNYAIHGTSLDEENTKYSADAPGGIERGMAKVLQERNGGGEKPVMVFINGSEGDVAPAEDTYAGIEHMGASFGEQASRVLDAAIPVTGPWTIKTANVMLEKGRLDIGACGLKIAGMPIGIKLYLSKKAVPPNATIWQFDWSGMTIMTWPGEPLTSMFDITNAAAEKLGKERVWTFGLTNGHMGYFPTPEEVKEGGYEPCVALHGKHAGETLAAQHIQLMHSSK